MDKISALAVLIQEASGWTGLSLEEVIEQALLEYLYERTGVVIEFKSFSDKEQSAKKKPFSCTR